MADPAVDPLGRLAGLLRRPRESLTAFAGLSDAELNLLATAIEATFAQRSEQLERELGRTLSPKTSRIAAKLLRGPGIAAIRRILIGRIR